MTLGDREKKWLFSLTFSFDGWLDVWMPVTSSALFECRRQRRLFEKKGKKNHFLLFQKLGSDEPIDSSSASHPALLLLLVNFCT